MAYQFKYTERDLKALEKAYKRGDETAEDTLRSEIKRLAKAANSRLLRLERAGLSDQSQAYARSMGYLNEIMESNRYRVSKKMDMEDLLDEYRELRLFLNKETSTVSGLKRAQKRLFNTLDAYNIHIAEENRGTFYEFLGSSVIQDVIDYIGEYDIVMDAIANNVDKIGGDLTKLEKQFNAFLSGEIFYDELLERIGGITIEELYNRSRARGLRRKRSG